MSIKFGTDGWRAIIAKDFTYENLQKVALAAASFFLRHPKAKNGICIGYDTRFMSKDFASFSSKVMSSMGLKVLLSDSFVPTPAVSLFTKEKELAGGIVITASHNPPSYNGFKIKGDYGGPAHTELISEVEAILANQTEQTSIKYQDTLIHEVDMKKLYLDKIASGIDLDAIKSSKINVVHHAMFGAGQGYLKSLLGEGIVQEYHSEQNPSFKGINPEPIAKYTQDFIPFFKKGNYDVSIINDGDADRVGMLDERGQFVDAHKIFCLILDYLLCYKGMSGEVAKTFTLTNMIDKICEKMGVKMHVLPVGFKYVGKLMNTNDILIGGEESGGFAVRSHIPERDGLFIGLLVLEIMVKQNKKLSDLVSELSKKYGNFFFDRVDVYVSSEQKRKTLERIKDGKIRSIGEMNVVQHDDLDGNKYIFEGGWLLIRASGTEPMIRFYAESDNIKKTQHAIEFAKQLLI